MMKYLLSNLEDILSMGWEIDSVLGRIRLDYTRLYLVILRFVVSSGLKRTGTESDICHVLEVHWIWTVIRGGDR